LSEGRGGSNIFTHVKARSTPALMLIKAGSVYVPGKISIVSPVAADPTALDMLLKSQPTVPQTFPSEDRYVYIHSSVLGTYML